MYLFVLTLCGMLEYGQYFLIYGIAEICLIFAVWKINKFKNAEHTPSLQKSIGELLLCRIGSTILWDIVFSVSNILLTPKTEDGWEVLDYWFPPDLYFFYHPDWRLLVVLVFCLLLTVAAFQMDMRKKRKWFYYGILAVTSLMMFCILTSAGLPVYWH